MQKRIISIRFSDYYFQSGFIIGNQHQITIKEEPIYVKYLAKNVLYFQNAFKSIKSICLMQSKQQLQNTIKKAYNIIKSLLCQHRECYSEIINVELGNCPSSILEEILGKEEAIKKHKMRIKIVRCINCGREIERTYIEDESPNVQENKKL